MLTLNRGLPDNNRKCERVCAVLTWFVTLHRAAALHIIHIISAPLKDVDGWLHLNQLSSAALGRAAISCIILYYIC